MTKIRVGIFFGGRSTEHEISIQSAKSIIKNLNRSTYQILLIGVDSDGRFFLGEESISKHMPLAAQMLNEVRLCSGDHEEFSEKLPDRLDENLGTSIDVAFPIIHGSGGEDGTIQGLLGAYKVPFVGTGVLGSAMGMDKDITKRILRDAGIPITNHRTYRRQEYECIDYEEITSTLGDIVFVKPASLGSSVGVSQAATKADFIQAINEAFLYDNKIIIEEFIQGREIECAVLGNEYPEASCTGEIVVKGCFYSYGAKYLNEYDVDLKIPAELSPEIAAKIRKTALKAFRVLCCEGMARVDFFLRGDHEVLLNEINTVPGFTEISMYPKLWEASGVQYGELLDTLIMLALSRHKRDNNLRMTKN
ncbi:MAG: D-alanine--D-alanine ligase [Holosporaceae bacterium]|jgi:D-alanine-D-alanine ligase|nr:D-alanine--D-alanine ligase [Holosporaceae bacterium]